MELRGAVERAGAIAESETVSAASIQGHGSVQERIVPLSQAVADFKRRHILETLERFGGNRSKTARALGVDPRTVFRILEQEDAKR